MARKIFVAALALGLLLSACGKKRLTAAKITKNPRTVPTVPTSTGGGTQIDPKVVRSAMPKLELEPNFEAAIQKLGLYTPDNCFQWVKLTKDGKEIGNYLELSAVTCPGGANEVVPEDKVLLRLKVQQHPQYFTQYRVIIEQSASPEIGVFRKTTIDGVDHYSMEGLCNLDPNGYDLGWDQYCNIAIDQSMFRSPDPLDFFNLD